MKLRFTELETKRNGTLSTTNFKSHIVNSFEDCENDTEKELWKMHVAIPDECWKLGCIVAHKIED